MSYFRKIDFFELHKQIFVFLIIGVLRILKLVLLFHCNFMCNFMYNMLFGNIIPTSFGNTLAKEYKQAQYLSWQMHDFAKFDWSVFIKWTDIVIV